MLACVNSQHKARRPICQQSWQAEHELQQEWDLIYAKASYFLGQKNGIKVKAMMTFTKLQVNSPEVGNRREKG